MCDLGYFCANFGLPSPLCSRLRPDVRDRHIDRRQTDVRQKHRLMSPPIRGGCIIRQFIPHKFAKGANAHKLKQWLGVVKQWTCPTVPSDMDNVKERDTMSKVRPSTFATPNVSSKTTDPTS